MEKYKSSPLWEEIFSTNLFSKDNVDGLNDEINYKIAQYNPSSHGVLFLNNILYTMAKKLDEKMFLLEKIKNRTILTSYSICYRGVQVNLDYLQALDECLFLEKTLESSFSILEIGAGYGRTCHSILSLHQSLQSYSIVDFPEMLLLCEKYLAKVLDKETFNKIEFLNFEAFSLKEASGVLFDLVINIDSMQEMPEKTVYEYFNFIDRHSKKFYTKNTVGKFSPSLVGAKESVASELALQSGILRESVNIFCPDDLDTAQRRFMEKFSPSRAWTVHSHGEALPWSHYYQALYVRGSV